MPRQLLLGPLVLDVPGLALSNEDRERLCHPLVGGVILFARNYAESSQLAALCDDIHRLRDTPLPIFVDHEGGRVQRFRAGFTPIPAMAQLGQYHDQAPSDACDLARDVGRLIALELRAHGVDMSFTPVLDLDWGRSEVMASRVFHRQAETVGILAAALVRGLADLDMRACGKHFPGHGWASADSHVAVPIDERAWVDIERDDIQPYRPLIDAGLAAVMPAHVIYPAVDALPAGFSAVWLRYLREQLKFDGVIFSDDLSMAGAEVVGGMVDRAMAASNAGCDVFLVCNNLPAADEILDGYPERQARVDTDRRLTALLPRKPTVGWRSLKQDSRWQALSARVLSFNRVD